MQDVLDTPRKLDLLRPVRRLLSPRGGLRARLDELAPYHRMHTPMSVAELLDAGAQRDAAAGAAATATSATPALRRSQSLHAARAPHEGVVDPEAGTASGPPRDVTVRRGTRRLGLSLRGGREMRLGLYVAFVQPSTPADAAGLVPGDRLLAINDTKCVCLLLYLLWFGWFFF